MVQATDGEWVILQRSVSTWLSWLIGSMKITKTKVERKTNVLVIISFLSASHTDNTIVTITKMGSEFIASTDLPKVNM